MASLLSQMAMSDQLYQKQQQEKEDRAFDLLKRKNEQAKIDAEAYIRPMEIADYEDKRSRNQKELANQDEQKRLEQWVKPYEPKLGVNADGTRRMDITTPMYPAMAATILPGAGMMAPGGVDLSGFIKPYADEAMVNSRSYQTPEETMKKADAETEHKRALELAAARKTAQRTQRATSSGYSRSPSAGQAKPTVQTKQADDFRKKALNLYTDEFTSKTGKAPDPDEWAQLNKKATEAMERSFPLLSATQPFQPEQPKPPAATAKPVPKDPMEDMESLVAPPTPKSANLQEKQASNIAPIAAPSPSGFDATLSQLGVTVPPPSSPRPLVSPENGMAEPIAPAQASIARAIGKTARMPSQQPVRHPQPDPAVSIEDTQREIMKKQWQASQSELRGIESFPRVASIVEQQLRRRLTDDEKGYLAENAEDLFSDSGTEFDLINGTYKNLSGEIRPISEIITDGFDFAASQTFGGFANTRDDAFRKVAKWLQPIGISADKVDRDL